MGDDDGCWLGRGSGAADDLPARSRWCGITSPSMQIEKTCDRGVGDVGVVPAPHAGTTDEIGLDISAGQSLTYGILDKLGHALHL